MLWQDYFNERLYESNVDPFIVKGNQVKEYDKCPSKNFGSHLAINSSGYIFLLNIIIKYL